MNTVKISELPHYVLYVFETDSEEKVMTTRIQDILEIARVDGEEFNSLNVGDKISLSNERNYTVVNIGIEGITDSLKNSNYGIVHGEPEQLEKEYLLAIFVKLKSEN